MFAALSQHRHSATALRLFAAGLVFASHASVAFGLTMPDLSTLGLILFFSVSGILISRSARNSAFTDFLRRRVARIFPGLLLVNLGTIPILVFFASIEGVSLGQFFAFKRGGGLEFLALTLLFPITSFGQFTDLTINPLLPGSINGALWTIPLEFQCYLICVGITFASKNTKLSNRYFAALAFSLFVLSILGNYLPDTNFDARLALFAAFFAGAWASDMDVKKIFAMGIVAFATVFIAVAYVILNESAVTFFSIAILGPWIVLAFVKAFEFMKLKITSDVSYGTYLWHYPVIQLTTAVIPGNPIVQLSVAVVITLALATFSWRYVESRFISSKH